MPTRQVCFVCLLVVLHALLPAAHRLFHHDTVSEEVRHSTGSACAHPADPAPSDKPEHQDHDDTCAFCALAACKYLTLSEHADLVGAPRAGTAVERVDHAPQPAGVRGILIRGPPLLYVI